MISVLTFGIHLTKTTRMVRVRTSWSNLCVKMTLCYYLTDGQESGRDHVLGSMPSKLILCYSQMRNPVWWIMYVLLSVLIIHLWSTDEDEGTFPMHSLPTFILCWFYYRWNWDRCASFIVEALHSHTPWRYEQMTHSQVRWYWHLHAPIDKCTAGHDDGTQIIVHDVSNQSNPSSEDDDDGKHGDTHTSYWHAHMLNRWDRGQSADGQSTNGQYRAV